MPHHAVMMLPQSKKVAVSIVTALLKQIVIETYSSPHFVKL